MAFKCGWPTGIGRVMADHSTVARSAVRTNEPRAFIGSGMSCLTARFPLCRCRSAGAATAPTRVAGLRSR